MTYQVFGPFNSGGPPGIQASFLNGLETYLASLNSAATDANIGGDGIGNLSAIGVALNPSGTSINGSTSGTVTLYQLFRGLFKMVMVYGNNFKNGGGSNQSIALPVAFSSAGFIYCGGTPAFSLLLAGATKTIQVQSALAAGSAGSVSPQTVVYSNTIAHIDTGFDTIQFIGGQATAQGGLVFILGM